MFSSERFAKSQDAETMSLDVQPITPTIGAIVRGEAEDMFADGVPGQILEALDRFSVLVFPRINMSDEHFLQLTAALGEKHENKVTDDGTEASDKGIFRIALDKVDIHRLLGSPGG